MSTKGAGDSAGPLAELRRLREQLAGKNEYAEGLSALGALLDANDAEREESARHSEVEARFMYGRGPRPSGAVYSASLERYCDSQKALAAVLCGASWDDVREYMGRRKP